MFLCPSDNKCCATALARRLLVGLDGIRNLICRELVIDDHDGHAPLEKFAEMLVVSYRKRRPKDQAINPAIQEATDLAETLIVVLLKVGHFLAITDPHRG